MRRGSCRWIGRVCLGCGWLRRWCSGLVACRCLRLGRRCGCLTGEHGVGIEKRDLMRCQFDDADLAQQIRVRAAFDPRWLLNTDKVFPLDFRCQG